MSQTTTLSDLPQPAGEVFYVPSDNPPPVLASIPPGTHAATIHHVHNERLVDLLVKPAEAEQIYVRFVPFLHPGDPDPGSPMGRCHIASEHAGKDYTKDHEIAQGLRKPDETVGPDVFVIHAGDVGSVADVLGGEA